ncbi:MAG: hypothetical protein GF308_06100 [Candidatus Heimdallarchaeota archaeon]|nr:hypothetical protein [Candidatus Heimdallarchaeota archaeon]
MKMTTKNEKSNEINKELLPSTYLVVLSIVASGAKYGYQINKILEERGYRQWVEIKFSSIYKSLRQLEDKGLIEGEKIKESLQPSKKTYTITPKGSAVLKYNIFTYLSNPPRPKGLFDLALSGIRFLSQEQALTALKAYKENLEKRIAFLKSNLEVVENIDELREKDPDRFIGHMKVSEFEDDPNLPVIHALFELPIKKATAEKQWLENFIEKIKRNDLFEE